MFTSYIIHICTCKRRTMIMKPGNWKAKPPKPPKPTPPKPMESTPPQTRLFNIAMERSTSTTRARSFHWEPCPGSQSAKLGIKPGWRAKSLAGRAELKREWRELRSTELKRSTKTAAGATMGSILARKSGIHGPKLVRRNSMAMVVELLCAPIPGFAPHLRPKFDPRDDLNSRRRLQRDPRAGRQNPGNWHERASDGRGRRWLKVRGALDGELGECNRESMFGR